jgi:hypothetical protein
MGFGHDPGYTPDAHTQYGLVPGPGGDHVSFGLWSDPGYQSQYNNIAYFSGAVPGRH